MARTDDQEEPNDESAEEYSGQNRESIWTIPTKLKRWYFALFSIQIVIATAWLARSAIADESINGISGLLFYTWQNTAPAAVSSATFALVIVDGINGIMVLSTWLEEVLEKRKQQQIKAASDKAASEARAEATAEVQKRWEAWNRRREAAAIAGDKFNELPPGAKPDGEDRQK